MQANSVRPGQVPECPICFATSCIFPQQRKLTGSSAQNSSGVHWCRRQVRFNEVPEKVPKVPEQVWEALVQSQVRFDRVPEEVPEKVWEALVQSQVRFNRVPEKVLEKVPENVWEALVQSQVRRRFRRRCERLWCRARLGSTGVRRRFRRRFREALVQSQVRFNRVPEKFPEGSGRLWCRARSGSTGFAVI